MATSLPSNVSCEQAHFVLSAYVDSRQFNELPLTTKEFREKCPGGTCMVGGALLDFRPCLATSFFATKKLDLKPFDAVHGDGVGESALKKASAIAKDTLRAKIATYMTSSPS